MPDPESTVTPIPSPDSQRLEFSKDVLRDYLLMRHEMEGTKPKFEPRFLAFPI